MQSIYRAVSQFCHPTGLLREKKKKKKEQSKDEIMAIMFIYQNY